MSQRRDLRVHGARVLATELRAIEVVVVFLYKFFEGAIELSLDPRMNMRYCMLQATFGSLPQASLISSKNRRIYTHYHEERPGLERVQQGVRVELHGDEIGSPILRNIIKQVFLRMKDQLALPWHLSIGVRRELGE